MQSLRNQFLTSARLTIDKYRRCRVRNGLDQLAYIAHRWTITNDGIGLSHQIVTPGGIVKGTLEKIRVVCT